MYQADPTSVVDNGVIIGPGTKIWHFSHIITGSEIGKNCTIGQNVMIGPNVTVGNGCKIQNNVSVFEGVTLEDNVFCGPGVTFTNDVYPRAEIPLKEKLQITRIRTGASVGANATILCGITIGRYAMVGAGAVVTKNVPDFALVVGNPAVQTGWVCICGRKLSQNRECSEQHAAYEHSLH
ncbi:MAG: DapH/DapD/GlmU-related protein [Acidobacteriota bacterium]